jgi:hypothetical protein
MSRGLAGKGNDVNPANPDEQLSDRGTTSRGVRRGIYSLTTVATGKGVMPLDWMVEGSRETCCL